MVLNNVNCVYNHNHMCLADFSEFCKFKTVKTCRNFSFLKKHNTYDLQAVSRCMCAKLMCSFIWLLLLLTLAKCSQH
jgi:hypothetical protein